MKAHIMEHTFTFTMLIPPMGYSSRRSEAATMPHLQWCMGRWKKRVKKARLQCRPAHTNNVIGDVGGPFVSEVDQIRIIRKGETCLNEMREMFDIIAGCQVSKWSVSSMLLRARHEFEVISMSSIIGYYSK